MKLHDLAACLLLLHMLPTYLKPAAYTCSTSASGTDDVLDVFMLCV